MAGGGGRGGGTCISSCCTTVVLLHAAMRCSMRATVSSRMRGTNMPNDVRTLSIAPLPSLPTTLLRFIWGAAVCTARSTSHTQRRRWSREGEGCACGEVASRWGVGGVTRARVE